MIVTVRAISRPKAEGFGRAVLSALARSGHARRLSTTHNDTTAFGERIITIECECDPTEGIEALITQHLGAVPSLAAASTWTTNGGTHGSKQD